MSSMLPQCVLPFKHAVGKILLWGCVAPVVRKHCMGRGGGLDSCKYHHILDANVMQSAKKVKVTTGVPFLKPKIFLKVSENS